MNIFGKQQKKGKIYQKMLREIANDDLTPKKRDSVEESEFFENETNPEPLYE